MKRYGLSVHPDKTEIVYCKDSNRIEQTENPIQFSFLGFTFKPRRAKSRNGKIFTGFLPALSSKAKIHAAKQYTIGDYYARLEQTDRNWHTSTMLLSKDGLITLVCTGVVNL